VRDGDLVGLIVDLGVFCRRKNRFFREIVWQRNLLTNICDR